jgi:acylphosphatase
MKIRMIISGSKVHGVGYRPWLTDMAISCGLCGFQANNRIENGNPSVIVLAEGDEGSVSYFEDLVRSNKPELAVVDTIEVSEFSGKVISLEKYAAINTSAQLNKAIPLLLGMNNKMDRMLEKQDETVAEVRGINKKMDQMLGKQDQMLEKQDQMLEKQDQMLVKQDETTGEIRDLRDDLVYHSNTDRLKRMEKDIGVIKNKIGIM